jgi:hypothetical protein
VALDTSRESSWKQLAVPNLPNLQEAIEFSAGRFEEYLPLALRALDASSPAATTVDRVWMQTWMSHEMRQERAAFRFRTASPQVVVELAPQTPELLEVLLDGENDRVVRREPGRIVIALRSPLTEGDEGSSPELVSHTLELRYRIPAHYPLVARHVMTPHQMIGTTALSQVYWHVVLDADRHVIRSPTQLASASRWQWLGSFLGRHPSKTQAELEEWVGALRQIAPSSANNEYLFTGLAPMSSIVFVTAPRWLIVLAGSACVLALVLACIYMPAMRRRWLLAAVGCLLACVALAFPMLALLLAQASFLGAVLAILAMLIARLVSRPPQWQVIIPASGAHRPITLHPDSNLPPPVAGTGSTAPTASLRMSELQR